MSNIPPVSSTIHESASPASIADSARRPGADVIKKILGISVSAAAIGVMALSVDWGKVGASLANMHYWVVIPALLLIAVQMIFRGLRWRCLLPRTDEVVSTRVLVDAIMVGNLASSVLPLRAGEFVRPLLLSFQTRHSFPTGFVSVIIERFFDLSAVLLSFGAVILVINDIPPIMVKGALLLSVLASALLIFILVGAVLPQLVSKCSSYLCAFLSHNLGRAIERFVLNLLEGASALRSPTNLGRVIGYSIIIWLVTYLSYYVFFWLFDIPGTLTQAVVVTVFVALAVAAPSAPGFIGVYQLGCIAALSLFSVDLEVATAYALITHLIQYSSSIIYGGYALSRTEWKLRDLIKRAPTNRV